jgi:hypothetical protein
MRAPATRVAPTKRPQPAEAPKLLTPNGAAGAPRVTRHRPPTNRALPAGPPSRQAPSRPRPAHSAGRESVGGKRLPSDIRPFDEKQEVLEGVRSLSSVVEPEEEP